MNVKVGKCCKRADWWSVKDPLVDARGRLHERSCVDAHDGAGRREPTEAETEALEAWRAKCPRPTNTTRYFGYWCPLCPTRISIETESPDYLVGDGAASYGDVSDFTCVEGCPACGETMADTDSIAAQMLARGDTRYIGRPKPNDTRLDEKQMHEDWRKANRVRA